MRHKYHTKAFVIGCTPQGEANHLVKLLTSELGLVEARAQSVRRSGAKLAPALVTLAESEVMLVRGGEGWRLSGAVLTQNWCDALPVEARSAAGRVAALLARLMPSEVRDEAPFKTLEESLTLWRTEPEAHHEAIECRAVLRLLTSLGLDTGALPELPDVLRERTTYITRINRGLAASGL